MTITEKEWFIEAPWGRICIMAWGHCHNPPVLVCHGLMDTITSFRSLIKLLPENFYYIGLDLPGSGKSDPFPPGLLMNLYDLVSCLEVVVKHFRWDNFIFLGHCAGALAGMLYDFCLPGRITKLIQLDPITKTVEPKTFTKWYERSYQKFFDDYRYYSNQKERRPVYTKEEVLKKIMGLVGAIEKEEPQILERLTEHVGNGLLRFTYDQRYTLMPGVSLTPDQLRSLCVQSEAEVLYIISNFTLQEGKYSTVPFLLDESIHKYRVKQVDEGHNIHRINPEKVAGYISQFLIHGLEGLGARAKL